MTDGKKHKGEIQQVGEAIRDLLRAYHLESRFDEAALLASWPEIVGPAVAKRTRKVYIQNKVLFVELNSSAMKNDFLLHKQRILELFQEKFGREVITDITVR
jgi:predicted nucleic acid-binding Zn ribbon protein